MMMNQGKNKYFEIPLEPIYKYIKAEM